MEERPAGQDRAAAPPVQGRAHGYPGRLIAVEGLDGSGKSTQIYLLRRWLEISGIKVFFTEWNSSLLVKRATRKGKKRLLLTPTTFSLIHATDFADRYEQQILPLMQAGCVVLADRYIFTAFARDVVRGCDPEWVRRIYSFAVMPDIALYFRLACETAAGRILAGRPKLKYFEAGLDIGLASDPAESFRLFQARIRDEYDRMAPDYGFLTVDAAQSIEVQQEHVRRLVAERIDLRRFRRGSRR